MVGNISYKELIHLKEVAGDGNSDVGNISYKELIRNERWRESKSVEGLEIYPIRN